MLKLKNISVTYGKKTPVHALESLDFHLREKEFVTVTGPSGSGKTTFIQVCGGILSPTGGEVEFQNQQLHTLDDDALSIIRNSYIGYVFQFFNLLPYLNALENVALPLMLRKQTRKQREQAAAELLESVGLGQRMRHYPNELSGGECQRVAIARALVTKPCLLIADEPTGNLDYDNTQHVIEMFEQLHKTRDVSVLMVTHDPMVAACGSRHVKIEAGRLHCSV
jgi:putative ABC transport system ATP-binding protein